MSDIKRRRQELGEGAERILDPRKAAILQAVVSRYIGTAQPVGSQQVAGAAGIGVSSATVRAEMAALEGEGYLTQPHTSAGRIPTDKGYRFFVDHLAAPGVLGQAQRQQVSQFFDQVHGEMEEMLERASGLLANLTSYAAVVVGPGHESAVVRSIQLVGLEPSVALLVAVLADGAVEKRSVDLGADTSPDVLALAAAALQSQVNGRTLSGLDPIAPTGDPECDRVLSRVGGALSRGSGDELHDHVFVGGPSHLALAFDAVETVRGVLGILEQEMVVVTLLREVLGRGLSVAIGAEHGYEPLASCAVVVAPVSVEGYEGGAVGLLGPTRMNYPEALAAANLVSEGISDRLAGLPGVGRGSTRSSRRRAKERTDSPAPNPNSAAATGVRGGRGRAGG
ncbi:MAG: heat-inducible transcriptional repressor HrcA [Acidimicrobiales bacterium]